jgi:hypothetical protein
VPPLYEYCIITSDSIKGDFTVLAADRSEEGLCPAGFVTSAKFDYACYI